MIKHLFSETLTFQALVSKPPSGPANVNAYKIMFDLGSKAVHNNVLYIMTYRQGTLTFNVKQTITEKSKGYTYKIAYISAAY